MGNCQSDAEDKQNKQIDGDIKKQKRTEERHVKILLLGAGESGKSTIFKQMKIIHDSGYTEDERKSFRVTVHSNCIQNMEELINAAQRLEEDMSQVQGAVEVVQAASKSEAAKAAGVTKEIAAAIQTLWASPPIQTVYSKRSTFQLADSAAYYFEAADRLAEPGYIPTDQDILRSRVRTSGIVETSFELENITFKMYDVGGQRNERRKWIHCFDNVNAVLFVAALSEYDQVLFEDDTQNRIDEALSLFGEICNSRFFKETAMILFLNKRDLFQEKITQVPMGDYFPDYTGGPDYDAGVEFLRERFLDTNKVPDKMVYAHVTCATDTGNIEYVFAVVKDVILQANLRGSGFI